MIKRNIALGVGMALAVLAVSAPARAQDARHPVIAGYGAIAPLEDAANRPKPGDDMRVLFEITSDATGSESVNRGLDKVARYLNLLGSAGASLHAGEVKVIIHGPATPLVLSDEAYRARFGSANPNTGLIASLKREGVDIHVCGQALAGHKLARETVNPAIMVDLSAMTTVVLLQRQGWPLLSD